jgi:hypothetical protein
LGLKRQTCNQTIRRWVLRSSNPKTRPLLQKSQYAGFAPLSPRSTKKAYAKQKTANKKEI